ncbi:ribonuclease H-like domain-containing protein [Thermosynechococcus sp. TA-1]|uniref:ribonuclease H-like domain-containing protein n=1 Tax=Thermosynechococcus sp. TA-1 TaxID=2813673 RepID=UPI00197D3F4A|nr:ribonuclease H-like domain-containing protein [Thermosynechococcus sp. TA-1]QSF49501.1 ribonuclease D [Thermosynechococcus sp. TA-1]
MDLDFPLECFDHDLSATALAHFLNADQLAVDTETMGLNIPRDRLCLVQLCDPEGQVAVIKIARGQKEAPHLQQLLEHPRITKIFHYARFDLATLRYHLGIRVHPVFCTKIASKIARTYSPRHGLKDLVLDLLGIEIDKSAQSSDWGNAMALREDQLRYAANDVRYLIPLRQQLTAMLKREERFELVQTALSCLPAIVDLDLAGYTQVFEHG